MTGLSSCVWFPPPTLGSWPLQSWLFLGFLQCLQTAFGAFVCFFLWGYYSYNIFGAFVCLFLWGCYSYFWQEKWSNISFFILTEHESWARPHFNTRCSTEMNQQKATATGKGISYPECILEVLLNWKDSSYLSTSPGASIVWALDKCLLNLLVKERVMSAWPATPRGQVWLVAH